MGAAGAGAGLAAVGAIEGLVGMGIGAGAQAEIKRIMSNLPGFNAVNPTDEQAAAIKGNVANFNDATKLSAATNAFNSDQLLAMLKKAVPGFSELQEKRTQIASDRMSGKISPDVANAVWSSSAGRALGLGIGGSGAGRNLTARDLGTTSMAIQDSGAKMFSDIVGSTPRPGMFDPSSMFLTPAQRVSYAFQNNENLYSSAMQQALGKTTPGATMYWAQGLQNQGNELIGAGAGIAGAGGGSSGGGMKVKWGYGGKNTGSWNGGGGQGGANGFGDQGATAWA